MNQDYWFYYFDNYYRWMNSYLNLLVSSGYYGKNFFNKYIEDVSQFAPPVSDEIYVERMFDDNQYNDGDNSKVSSGYYGKNFFNKYIEDVSQFAPPVSDEIYVERMFDDNQYNDGDNSNNNWDNNEWDNDQNWDNNGNWNNNNNNNNESNENDGWNDNSAQDYGFGEFGGMNDTQLNISPQQGVQSYTNAFSQCKCYQILKVQARKNNQTIRFIFIPTSIANNGLRGYILSCNNNGLNLINTTVPFSAILRISCVSL